MQIRALKVKMWPLRCSENRQDNDSETGILKYGDAAGSSIGECSWKQYWRFAVAANGYRFSLIALISNCVDNCN